MVYKLLGIMALKLSKKIF